jgi:hypothetical protein
MSAGFDYIENLVRRLIDPLNLILQAINRLIDGASVGSDKYAKIQNVLTSATVQAFPNAHQQVIVTTTMTEIARNVSADYIAVRITDADAAQELYYGRDNLTTLNGEVLYAGQNVTRILCPGDVMYGIVRVFQVSIRVARLQNLNEEIKKLPEERL